MSLTESEAIRQMLRTRLLATPGRPEGVALDGWTFTPTIGVAFVEEWFKPSNARTMSLGPNPLRSAFGQYLVNVYTPVGMGNGEADRLVDAIMLQFRVGEGSEILDGVTLCRGEPERGPPQRSQDWRMVPVTIPWHTAPQST